MLGLRWMTVKVLPHEDVWHEDFLRAKDEITNAWNENVIEIEHVGSTAIRNICAKPIIDIAVVVRSFTEMDISALETVGYRYMGLRNAADNRHIFAKYAENDEELVTHHVHIYEPENQDYIKLIGFRDYLNSAPEAAMEYNRIKMVAANANPEDRFAYSAAKRDFIERIDIELQMRRI